VQQPTLKAKYRSASLAKTTRPSLSAVVPRSRLFALLDSGRKSSVLWITGPPGSGKTTLVGSYLDRRKLNHIWYQLDSGDADVATFFYYMSLAAEEHESRKNEMLPLLAPEYQTDISTFARRYSRDLFHRLTTPFVLILDNYDEVPMQSNFHQIMPDMLSEVPPKGCVILISRREPAPSMARLRASGALEVIGWNELQLTLNETKALLKLRGLKLARAMALQLYERTQGWAAGLMLMIQQGERDRLPAAIPKDSAPQVVFDFLAGELFQKLDDTTRNFALKTAIFPQMTANMAAELTGNPDAARLLADGHRNNYFVNLKQAQPEPVYGYHPLFREFLLARARADFKEAERRTLQRRAAQLLETAGQLEYAVELLTDIPDWKQMVDVILQHAASMLDQGRAQTLSQWLEELPAEVLQRNPWALYWLATCRLAIAPRESRRLCEQAFQIFKSQPEQDMEGLLLACAGVMDAILYEMDDLTRLDRWIAELDSYLQQRPDFPSLQVEARVTSAMCLTLLLRQPYHADITNWLERATSILPTLPDPNQRIVLGLILALDAMWTGRFSDALAIVNAMRDISASPTATPLVLTGLKTIESMYYMLIADGERCIAAVEDGLRVARETGVQLWSYQTLVNGIGGALGAGDLETAKRLLTEAQDHPEGSRLDRCIYHHYAAWDAMLRNDTLRAFQEQKRALKLAIDVGCPHFEVLCRLALTQVLFHYGDERKIVRHLREVHRIARRIRNHLLEFMCLLGYAQLALAHTRKRSGLNALRYALALGREHGFMHFVWWQPKVMARLCAHALDAGIEVPYVRQLIKQRGLILETPGANVKNWPWRFSICTFGQFKLQREGEAVGFTGKAQRKPMDLLRALIAFGGREVSEDRLTEALWPRIDGDSAHRSFTTTLHRLRKLLGEDKALVIKEGRLSLDGRYCWLDTWALEDTLIRVDHLLAQPRDRIDTQPLEELASTLLTLYQGPFMGGEPDRAWYLSAREQLRNRFLRSLAGIARHWEETDQCTKAIEYYQKALEADALAEGFYRHLMVCYQKLGCRAEAIETYHRCRKALTASLQVEPSPETQAVYESLRSGT
jgi:ATP/maltotriose-dependent transcriptional regulator MalT/DNA-binding SARP family transcriptional activator